MSRGLRVSFPLVLLMAGLVVTALPAEESAVTPAPMPVATMSDLMIKLIYPASDAVLYVSSREPTNDAEWADLQAKALLMAESANLLMMPERAVDQDQWMKDSQLMLDAGIAAYDAALEKDLDTLIDLNEAVYQSCVVCHLHYRPDYLKDAKLKLEDPPD